MESRPNLVALSGEKDSHAAIRVDVRAFSLVLALVRGGYGETTCCLSPFHFPCFICSVHGGHTCWTIRCMQPDCCCCIESRRVVSHKTHWYGCKLKCGVIFVFRQNNAAESKIWRPTSYMWTWKICEIYSFRMDERTQWIGPRWPQWCLFHW